MEQQKVLWIIFSVTLFLVVVVVVGFVWFLPSESGQATETTEATADNESSSKTFDPIVWVRGGEKVPGVSEEAKNGEVTGEQEGDLLLVYGETRNQTTEAEGAGPSEKGLCNAGAVSDCIVVIFFCTCCYFSLIVTVGIRL